MLDPDWALDGPGDDHILDMYAQVHYILRARVREDLQIVEELAIVACMDGVEWRLPEGDDETVRMLVLGRGEGCKADYGWHRASYANCGMG